MALFLLVEDLTQTTEMLIELDRCTTMFNISAEMMTPCAMLQLHVVEVLIKHKALEKFEPSTKQSYANHCFEG